MSHTEISQHPSWWIYSLSVVAAIIIGIDCAIDSAYFMHLMGGLYAAPFALVACCTAALIINSILYFNDLPTALDDFFGTKTTQTKPDTLTHMLNTIKYPVSVFSALGMALNTYWAYVSIHLAFTNPFIIACFCIAYGLGTYALISTAFDLSYQDDSGKEITIFKKFGTLKPTSKILTASLFGILTIANYWAINSMAVAATSALLALLPTIGIPSAACITTLTVFMLFGETVFSFKASIWLVSKYESSSTQETGKNASLSYLALYALATLNGIASAAITAAYNAKFTAIFGFFDATAGVVKALGETEENMIKAQKDVQHKAIMNKGIKRGMVLTFILTAWWASDYFALPFLTSLNLIYPPLALCTVIFAIGLTAYLIDPSLLSDLCAFNRNDGSMQYTQTVSPISAQGLVGAFIKIPENTDPVKTGSPSQSCDERPSNSQRPV